MGTRRVIAVTLAAVLSAALAGCSPPMSTMPITLPTDSGWPEVPVTVAVDEGAPPLPESGPVGRGAVLLTRLLDTHLVLTDGRQFRLPRPPEGEGRLGWIAATLSPDGQWLGHRTARYSRDPGYVVRSLVDGRVIETSGTPHLWSTDSRSLLMDDEGLAILDLASGESRRIDPVGSPLRAFVWGLAPGGQLVNVTAGPTSLEIQTGDAAAVVVTLAERADDACWCQALRGVLSPDGTRLTVPLSFREGLAPGTADTKVPERTDGALTLLVLDRATGAELVRTIVVPPAETFPRLVGDRGSDLVLALYPHDPQVGSQLAAADPSTGELTVLTTGPAGWWLVAPGELTIAPDG